MLTWFFVATTLLFVYLYGRVRWNNHLLCLDTNIEAARLELEIEQLHQGNIDLEESYEMVLLDMNDTIRDLQSKIIDRDEIIDHHATQCHGLVSDTIELIMDKLRPLHPDEEPEGVPADG